MTTTTKAKTKTRASAKPANAAGLRPTLGPVVCRWMERNLVHAEGDYFGKPFRLRKWQRALIYEVYELKPDGSRVYKEALFGFPKGQGKTELAAAISVAEFAGPVMFAGWKADGTPRGKSRLSPDIPVAAASFEQADHVFGAAKTMIKQGALTHSCEVYETEILLKGKPGRLYRVAAVAGTNDGGKPTFWVADELHEWTGTKERVHLVLSNNRRKRAGAWELAITTAGWDATSLLGRKYLHGRKVMAGEVQDPEFLFRWCEANPKWNLSKPDELEAAIREANPAVGDFLPLESLLADFSKISEFEFRRYHLNQWVSAPERWLPIGAWDAVADPGGPPPAGTPIMLGFDGSYSRDSTALVGCTLDGKLFVIDVWEKPANEPDWHVDFEDVETAIRKAFKTWRVKRAGCDPALWHRSLELLRNEFGKELVLDWPSHQAAFMVPACSAFYDAVVNKQLRHDGDPRLAQHVANCVVKIDHRGPRITKEHKDSPRKIDLAVAAVIAHDLVVRERPKASVYGVRGVRTV